MRNISDSAALFAADTLKSGIESVDLIFVQFIIQIHRCTTFSSFDIKGENECQEELVTLLAERSSAAIEFLLELGVPLQDIVILGGHSVSMKQTTT